MSAGVSLSAPQSKMPGELSGHFIYYWKVFGDLSKSSLQSISSSKAKMIRPETKCRTTLRPLQTPRHWPALPRCRSDVAEPLQAMEPRSAQVHAAACL